MQLQQFLLQLAPVSARDFSVNAFHGVFMHSGSEDQDFHHTVSLNQSQGSYILIPVRNYSRGKSILKVKGETS